MWVDHTETCCICGVLIVNALQMLWIIELRRGASFASILTCERENRISPEVCRGLEARLRYGWALRRRAEPVAQPATPSAAGGGVSWFSFLEKKKGGEKRDKTTRHIIGGDGPYGSSDGFGSRWGSVC
jgi:hypothetical protein